MRGAIVALFSTLALLLCLSGPVLAQTAAPGPVTTSERPDERRAASPRYRTLVPGLLMREVHRAIDRERAIEVRIVAFLVGPGQSTERIELEDDAVLVVRTGRGMISVDGDNGELALGITRSVPAGVPFTLENFDSAAPLSLRGVLLREAR